MVFLLRHLAHAWAEAVADDIFMAVKFRVFSGFRNGTTAQAVADFKKADGRPQGGRPRKRSEIDSCVFSADTSRLKAREVFRRIDADMQIAFVIPQIDVVSRIVLLDETVFQQEGFLFRLHGKDFVARDAVNESAAARIALHGSRWTEIGGHAAAQIARLADVNHFAAAVSIDINAWHARDVLAAKYGLFGIFRHKVFPYAYTFIDF